MGKKNSAFNYNFNINYERQVYHSIGSIFPHEQNNKKFLRVYFFKNQEDQGLRRCTNIRYIDKNLVFELQAMLNEHNIYVQQFKTAIEHINVNCNDLKIDDKNVIIKNRLMSIKEGIMHLSLMKSQF